MNPYMLARSHQWDCGLVDLMIQPSLPICGHMRYEQGAQEKQQSKGSKYMYRSHTSRWLLSQFLLLQRQSTSSYPPTPASS